MAWTRDERRALLDRVEALRLQMRSKEKARFSLEERRAMVRERRRLLVEYAENLPPLPVSRCPICQGVFELPMDPEGLDGPWWWVTPEVEFPVPRTCEHYQVVLGALDLHGRVPTEVRDAVQPGPGVPFVVPRLLSIERVRAVIASLNLATGDTAYPIVYYSEEPVPETELHQPWCRDSWVLHDDAGNPVAYDHSEDPWDFDLLPWIRSGKLSWILPGDEALRLRQDEQCPYIDLDGIREPQVLARGKLDTEPLPDGTSGGYYEEY